MVDKREVVKKTFEDTAQYLKYDYNLQIRKETVLNYTKGLQFSSVLDVPSGTGAMSIPLLNQTDQLTMVDISANMLSIAKAHMPEADLHKINMINADFFSLPLKEKSYDLIICLGMLAHVNSPLQLLKTVSSLLKPSGLLIIQNTDSNHFYNHFIRCYLALKHLVAKQAYPLNKVPGKFVEQILTQEGLKLEASFRYNQSFLGLSHLFSNDQKYNMTRWFFGDSSYNKHASWGSDVTYLFRKMI